jgi:NADPH:quinone reductase-like Zn-dependent oxidoreductase
MKAAVIDSPDRGPRFADFAEPVVADGETLIEVTAAGLHPIVRMLASGEHYGSQGTLPMIPGIDGTGRSPDGTRVYFGGVRPPYGPIAQRAAAPFVLPLPDGLDEVTAAAIINPGNGAWLALTRRAVLQPGETVLVLGATGVSGRIAVALAARMGAGRVIAAGRNRVILDQLGAAATVALGGPDDAAALADAAGPDGIHVIIDYLWGHPAEAAIAAITRRGMAHAAPRVRLVQVGQMAGPTIALPADVLRSSGLEILGSGPGTHPPWGDHQRDSPVHGHRSHRRPADRPRRGAPRRGRVGLAAQQRRPTDRPPALTTSRPAGCRTAARPHAGQMSAIGRQDR